MSASDETSSSSSDVDRNGNDGITADPSNEAHTDSHSPDEAHPSLSLTGLRKSMMDSSEEDPEPYPQSRPVRPSLPRRD